MSNASTHATQQQLEDMVRNITRGRYGVRADSALARRFLNGDYHATPEWTMHSVAHELAFIQWLYDQTPYRALQQSGIMRAVAEHCKQQYPNVSWTQVWERVREYCIPMLKAQAVYLTAGSAHMPACYDRAPTRDGGDESLHTDGESTSRQDATPR